MKRLFLLFIAFLIAFSICNYRKINLFSILSDYHLECIALDGDMNYVECECAPEYVISTLALDNLRRIRVDDEIIYEGYTNRLINYRVVNGNKINIQIACRGGITIVGYPLIYDSF